MKSEQGNNLSEMVYHYLLDMILSMKIKPGDRIPEARIASEFGISRTPIRDAMRQLANDGILNLYPNRFAEVANWDENIIKEIGITRAHLDNLAAKLAIFYGSNADFNRMMEHAKNCLQAALEDDVARKIKEDCAFHLELSVIAQNRQLIEFQKKIYLKIEFLQSWRGDFLENPQEQYRQHEEIVSALTERDEQEVIRLLTRHNIHFHNLEEDFPVDFFIKP